MSDLTDREQLSWMIHRACGCNGWCPPHDEDAAGADAILAAGWVSPAEARRREAAAAVWEEFLPNDGEYEYTSTSDCDGSQQKFLRRRPERRAESSPWEQCDAIPADVVIPADEDGAS